MLHGLKKTITSMDYEMEFILGRKKGIHRLQDILQEIFRETLREVPKAATLRKLAKEPKSIDF